MTPDDSARNRKMRKMMSLNCSICLMPIFGVGKVYRIWTPKGGSPQYAGREVLQLILVAHSLVQNSSNIRHRCRSLRDVEFGESHVQELRVHTNRQGVAIQTSMHMPANNTKKGVCGSNVESEKRFPQFYLSSTKRKKSVGLLFFSVPCLRWHCENF